MKGKIVKVKHCERSQYMNEDFLSWIDNHIDETFYVLEDYGNCVKLKGTNFTITKEFIEGVSYNG